MYMSIPFSKIFGSVFMNHYSRQLNIDYFQSDDIRKLKEYYLNSCRYESFRLRDYTLFVVGINTGLFPQDLLNLSYNDIANNDQMQEFLTPTETLHKKYNPYPIYLNQATKTALENYVQVCFKYRPVGFLFSSRRHPNDPLDLHTYNTQVRYDCKLLHIDGHYNSLSFRKTFLHYFLHEKESYTEMEIKQIYSSNSL